MTDTFGRAVQQFMVMKDKKLEDHYSKLAMEGWEEITDYSFGTAVDKKEDPPPIIDLVVEEAVKKPKERKKRTKRNFGEPKVMTRGMLKKMEDYALLVQDMDY